MLGLKGSKPSLRSFKIDFRGLEPDPIDFGCFKTRFWGLRGFGDVKPGLEHFQLGLGHLKLSLGSFKPLLKAANQAFGPQARPWGTHARPQGSKGSQPWGAQARSNGLRGLGASSQVAQNLALL